jgi:signal transduction histidine kinase
MTMMLPSKRVLARTAREAGFLASPLALAGLWLAALVTAWSLTVSLAFTPLVVPLAIGTALTVRGCAIVETALARSLLGANISLPAWSWGSGFWRRAWRVLTGSWLWRAQAYLVLRISVGFALAAALVSLLGAGLGLLTLPFYYRSLKGGADIGSWHVHTLAQALLAVPAGALVTVAALALVHPLARPWRALSVNLLDQVEQDGDRAGRPVSGEHAVRIHALASGGLSLFWIVIWALTSRGYFWPMWPMLALAAALAIHALVVFVAPLPWWREHRLDSGFAIHAGVWVALVLFFVGVWAASGAGYFWPVWPLLVALVTTGAHAAVLLSRDPDRHALTERISTLETSRAGAVDVQEAELRRIERDLHDGAQARLVALGMSLGMAEQKLASEPDAAAALLADARAGAGAALRELRDLARGIHPPVLADRGLDAAVRALAAGSPIAVTVAVTIPQRPRPPVESAAYFVVAEALANAGKHAEASRVDVSILRAGDMLSIEVRDNGRGGADPSGGGLGGLRRRVEALDGRLDVVSPPGGPTAIRAELPCG